ncbi:MAG: GIY-YIG nuclease family protein, partial [Streptococcus mitis]|nr:GIY-YIG nuclease family protein [Streptococcus mitis]
MAKRSKNINMFLMDGEVTGKIKCTLSNWTGVIYKIPRIQLGDLKSRDEMKQSGIYFLFGRDEDKQKDVTYIGQATTRKNGEGVLLRIQEHTRDTHADYFNDVIILTTQNNSFGPTEISYLENKFTQLAKEAGRYIVKNGNDPNPGNVTEEKESELDEIVENTLMIIGTLGYRVFVPMTKEVSQDLTDNHSTYLYLKRKTKKSNKVIEATCERTTEGFVVLEGSQVEIKDSPYLPASLKEMRQNLIASRVIQDGVLKEKQLFSSPSYAAAFLLGMQTNGRTDWKDQDGRTLKELEE